MFFYLSHVAGTFVFTVLTFCIIWDTLNKHFQRYKELLPIEILTLRIATKDTISVF